MKSSFMSILFVGVLAGITVGVPKEAIAGKADLYIGSHNVHVRDGRRLGMVEAASGGPAIVYFIVNNSGDTSAPKGVLVHCGLYHPSQNSPITQAQIKLSKPIKAHASYGLSSMQLKNTGHPGKRLIRCRIDPSNKIHESNENNNTVQKEITLHRFGKDAYRVQLSEFKPLEETRIKHLNSSAFFHLLAFRPYVTGGVPSKQFNKRHQAMWQADCQLNGYPWVDIGNGASKGRLGEGSMSEYPFGQFYQTSGKKKEHYAWLDINAPNYPSITKLPRKLQMICTIQVGAFTKMPAPRRSDGKKVIKEGWHPIQVWWKEKKTFSVMNPFSSQPALDVKLQALNPVGAPRWSSSKRIASGRDAWVNFELGSTQAMNSVEVLCTAKKWKLRKG